MKREKLKKVSHEHDNSEKDISKNS
jgi:hypothetical protein